MWFPGAKPAEAVVTLHLRQGLRGPGAGSRLKASTLEPAQPSRRQAGGMRESRPLALPLWALALHPRGAVSVGNAGLQGRWQRGPLPRLLRLGSLSELSAPCQGPSFPKTDGPSPPPSHSSSCSLLLSLCTYLLWAGQVLSYVLHAPA